MRASPARATFVVDKTGVVRKVDVNREALDPSGVVGMCQKLEANRRRWTCGSWRSSAPSPKPAPSPGPAKRLHVSQSAISRQILLLEEELNEAVFLRVGRRIRITPAGEALLQLSHRVFQDLKDTVALIGDSRQALRGPVRLVGGMTVRLYVFPALLREFRRLHPQSRSRSGRARPTSASPRSAPAPPISAC